MLDFGALNFKKYILPIPSSLRGNFKDYSRLYAYPVEPELDISKNNFIILDSGAFGLRKSGRQMNYSYKCKLNEHYKKFKASDYFPVLAVAPDVSRDIEKTMYNYKEWLDNGFNKVCPVIQRNSSKNIDFGLIKMQANFYKNFRPKVVFFAGYGTAVESKNAGLEKAITIVRDIIKSCEWVHVFGAGYFPSDIERWGNIRGLNSIDSIAYYTDKSEMSWDGNIYKNWTDKALNNGIIANSLINKNILKMIIDLKGKNE